MLTCKSTRACRNHAGRNYWCRFFILKECYCCYCWLVDLGATSVFLILINYYEWIYNVFFNSIFSIRFSGFLRMKLLFVSRLAYRCCQGSCWCSLLPCCPVSKMHSLLARNAINYYCRLFTRKVDEYKHITVRQPIGTDRQTDKHTRMYNAGIVIMHFSNE